MALKIVFNPFTGKFDMVEDTSDLVPQTRTITINGVTYDLSADRTWTVTATTETDYTNNFLLGGM